MNSDVGEVKTESESEERDEFADDSHVETVVLPESGTTDNVGDASVEINVEELIADIEGSGEEVSEHKLEVRRKLEEMAEEKSLDDTYAIEFDEA